VTMPTAAENSELMLNLEVWSLAIAVVTLVLGTVVSVVLYVLGRRLDFRSRMHRWDELRATARRLLPEVSDDHVPEVVLINARRYEREYDGGYSTNRHGELQLKAEFFAVRHNGIEFFCEPPRATWLDAGGRRTLRETSRRAPNTLTAGFVPFEYVEHINLDGDEYRGKPIFYVRFKGPGKSPYLRYTFHEFSPSLGGMSYPPIAELGEIRLNRLAGWFRFWTGRPRRYLLNRRINRMHRERVTE